MTLKEKRCRLLKIWYSYRFVKLCASPDFSFFQESIAENALLNSESERTDRHYSTAQSAMKRRIGRLRLIETNHRLGTTDNVFDLLLLIYFSTSKVQPPILKQSLKFCLTVFAWNKVEVELFSLSRFSPPSCFSFFALWLIDRTRIGISFLLPSFSRFLFKELLSYFWSLWLLLPPLHPPLPLPRRPPPLPARRPRWSSVRSGWTFPTPFCRWTVWRRRHRRTTDSKRKWSFKSGHWHVISFKSPESYSGCRK